MQFPMSSSASSSYQTADQSTKSLGRTRANWRQQQVLLLPCVNILNNLLDMEIVELTLGSKLCRKEIDKSTFPHAERCDVGKDFRVGERIFAFTAIVKIYENYL